MKNISSIFSKLIVVSLITVGLVRGLSEDRLPRPRPKPKPVAPVVEQAPELPLPLPEQPAALEIALPDLPPLPEMPQTTDIESIPVVNEPVQETISQEPDVVAQPQGEPVESTALPELEQPAELPTPVLEEPMPEQLPELPAVEPEPSIAPSVEPTEQPLPEQEATAAPEPQQEATKDKIAAPAPVNNEPKQSNGLLQNVVTFLQNLTGVSMKQPNDVPRRTLASAIQKAARPVGGTPSGKSK